MYKVWIELPTLLNSKIRATIGYDVKQWLLVQPETVCSCCGVKPKKAVCFVETNNQPVINAAGVRIANTFVLCEECSAPKIPVTLSEKKDFLKKVTESCEIAVRGYADLANMVRKSPWKEHFTP